MVCLRPIKRLYSSPMARWKAIKLTNYDFPSSGWKIAIGSLSISALAALKIWLMTSLEHCLESSLNGTSGEIFYVFSFVSYSCIEALRRLYIGGSIFQVPPVSDYSTCYTNPVRTRLLRQLCLRIQCTDHPLTHLVHLWSTDSSGGGAPVYRPRSPPQYKRQSPPSKRAYDTIRILCP